MKILLLTHSNDNECIHHVTEALLQKGAEVFRFNTDTYPASVTLSGSLIRGSFGYVLSTSEYRLNLSDLDAVWYRRLSIGSTLQGTIAQEYLRPSIDESRATFLGVLDTLPAFVFDSFFKHRYAENKFNQLKIAAAIGMRVPDTLMTNDQQALKTFYKKQNRDIISKMQHSFALYNDAGEEQVVFTNKVTPAHIRDAASVQYCPMKFQTRLRKRRELRVTVVGDRIFSAAVDSQKLPDAELDWRREGVALLWEWYEYPLPAATELQILQLMDALQLNYGALDFIESEDGSLHFLEINSGGEFYWLDVLFRHQISAQIAAVLAGEVPQRRERFPRI